MIRQMNSSNSTIEKQQKNGVMHNFMVIQGIECAQFGVVCDCNFSI